MNYKNKVYDPAKAMSTSRARAGSRASEEAAGGAANGASAHKKRKRVSSASFFADSGSEDDDHEDRNGSDEDVSSEASFQPHEDEIAEYLKLEQLRNTNEW